MSTTVEHPREEEQVAVRYGKIDGVVLQPLVRNADDRGYFEEVDAQLR